MSDREYVRSGTCTAGGFTDLFLWNWSRKSKSHHMAGKGIFINRCLSRVSFAFRFTYLQKSSSWACFGFLHMINSSFMALLSLY